MIEKVTLPDIGPAFESLAVERWLKKEGDAVAPGDVLCEVAIDKAILEVESRHAGLLLKILVPAGSPVPVGAVVAVIGEAGEKIPKTLLAPAKAGRKAATADGGAEGVMPLTPIRRIIANRMLQSKKTMPCYYLEIDADVTDLVAIRGKLGDRASGLKVTFNDLLIKACGLALKAFPIVNSRWVEGAGIERRHEVNVGFAVALGDGLVVPVVRDVDRKTVQEISRESADLVDRARTRKLRPEELSGGCMSITNLGIYGIKSFIPITNPGESTILGIGVIADRVVARGGEIQIRKMMSMTLAVDHRLIDGAVGAQFLELIRNLLEEPKRLT